ncbi:uncharacterized protein LOC135839870 [Planococcus citri]|uniref:uncharacterized protein LOC135839870 n=1 Tax=Planococcus citri TaxID=170843 RepID=UPI0031F85D33
MIPPATQFDVHTVVLPHSTCHKRTDMVNRQLVQNGNAASQELIQDEVVSSNDISERGLILPKKLLNPCLESPEHQHLRKELIFNNKIGKNVLNQKSELRKALEKHKDAQLKKELEQKKNESKSLLEKAVEDRAEKIEQMKKTVEEDLNKPEFLQVHAKLRAKMESKS